MRNSFLFTSESVSEGHPDKVADQISDSIVDLFLSKDPEARVACVNVIRTHRLGIDETTDATGTHIHVSRLMALKAWGARLGLPEAAVRPLTR